MWLGPLKPGVSGNKFMILFVLLIDIVNPPPKKLWEGSRADRVKRVHIGDMQFIGGVHSEEVVPW